jgi:RNA polymerase sigma-70 factor (ECF subfamily)
VLAARDNSERFIELFTRYQPRIFLFILSLVPNRADAEDVLSETSLVLWRKFHEFRPGTDFRAWAFEVASRRAKGFWEKNRRHEFRPSDDFLDRIAEASIPMLDDHQTRLEALDRCRAKLRPPDQDLLQRRYQRGATAASVAAEVGRSEGAVHKAVARIRQALLDCISKTLAQGEHP